MAIESSGNAQLSSTHDDETGAISEAVKLINAFLEQNPRGFLIRGSDMNHFNHAWIKKSSPDEQRSPVTKPRKREGDGLVKNVARRNQAT